MTKPRVVLTYPFHPEAIRLLLAPKAEIRMATTRARLRAELASGAEALFTLVTDSVDDSLLAVSTKLRVVANLGVGINNIDLEACRRHAVRVIHTPKVVTRATAEMALALLFAATRRMTEGQATCRKPRPWDWSPDLLLGLELKGRNAVLVGPGRIGRETAKLFRAVGMTTEFIARTDSKPSIRRALARAQVLSLHLPLSKATRHWLSAEHIQRLPEDAIVINTARGPVIDERALIVALAKRRIFGAGLDVHEREPRISGAMKRLPNVVLLPHLGTATRETRRAMAELVIRGALGVLAGKHPWNEVAL